MKIKSLEKKKVAILGFGVTGQEVYKALDKNLDTTIVSDVPVIGFNTLTTTEVFERNLEFDVIIKSPGVPYSHPLLVSSDAYVTNDIELCYEVVRDNHLNTKIIGITGTNGKTTTTQFIADVLSKTGKKSIACGNIGQSPLYVLSQSLHIDYLVMELSSYQLKQASKFTPDYALFLNIAPDHIDYHGTFEDYLNSKCNLFRNMSATQVLVLDQAMVAEHKSVVWPKFASFGASDEQLEGISTMAMPKQNYRLIFDLLLKLGIEPEYIKGQINNFKGLKHRLELVATDHDFLVINDSKATNVDATNVAISNLSNPTTLILGGSIKQEDYKCLDFTNKYVNKIIAYGEARHEFDFIPGVILIEDFSQAVKKAIEVTNPSEVLLLSPSCASFDQHKNYIMRGEQFKEIVGGKNE